MRKNKKTSPISYEEMMDRVSSLSLSSSTYKKFGLYIEKHYMDLGFMSAEEVADAVGISQGSVSRFCKDSGFLGYSDFLKNLHIFLFYLYQCSYLYSETSRVLHIQ